MRNFAPIPAARVSSARCCPLSARRALWSSPRAREQLLRRAWVWSSVRPGPGWPSAVTWIRSSHLAGPGAGPRLRQSPAMALGRGAVLRSMGWSAAGTGWASGAGLAAWPSGSGPAVPARGLAGGSRQCAGSSGCARAVGRRLPHGHEGRPQPRQYQGAGRRCHTALPVLGDQGAHLGAGGRWGHALLPGDNRCTAAVEDQGRRLIEPENLIDRQEITCLLTHTAPLRPPPQHPDVRRGALPQHGGLAQHPGNMLGGPDRWGDSGPGWRMMASSGRFPIRRSHLRQILKGREELCATPLQVGDSLLSSGSSPSSPSHQDQQNLVPGLPFWGAQHRHEASMKAPRKPLSRLHICKRGHRYTADRLQALQQQAVKSTSEWRVLAAMVSSSKTASGSKAAFHVALLSRSTDRPAAWRHWSRAGWDWRAALPLSL